MRRCASTATASGLREVRRMENARAGSRWCSWPRRDSPDAGDRTDLQLADERTRTTAARRNFGHLAFRVDDIYATCAHLQAMGVTINRPPRDGHMAFVRSPDLISIELLQKGDALPPREPWASMPNTGNW